MNVFNAFTYSSSVIFADFIISISSFKTTVVNLTTSSDEKTYPFYADDGSIVGYYHVGDVVEHYDGLYQLKSNGQWVYIGLSKNAQHANNQVSPEDDIERDDEDPADFQDTFEDPYDIEYEDDESNP